MSQELVSVEWLQQHLQDHDLRIVDCRWVLGQAGEGRRQYEAGHIPGAVHLDIDEQLTGKEGPGRHPLPSRFNFQKLIVSIGVSKSTHVVVYDAGHGMPAPRLWWLLKFYGHDNVSVLDGGWEGWLKEGGPVQTEIQEYSSGDFTARPKRKWVVDKATVDARRDETAALLIDARASERYRGEVEPIDAKAGHIPGSENFPYAQTIDPATGRFLPAETLKAEFKKIGVDATRDIVCYCGSGITACTAILALKIAGFEAQLYEGSWSDWSADANLPVATKK